MNRSVFLWRQIFQKESQLVFDSALMLKKRVLNILPETACNSFIKDFDFTVI